MGYSGHFDRKTRSPYTLQDVGKYILIFNIIISMQDYTVSGTYVEKYQFSLTAVSLVRFVRTVGDSVTALTRLVAEIF